MTGAFLTLSALVCGGSSAALAQRLGTRPDADPAFTRAMATIVVGLLVAGLGCLLWSKGV